MNNDFLKVFNLTDKEVQLYYLLLENGELLVKNIIELSKLKRATVYQSLYELEKRGLVLKREVNKKIHFTPASPDTLMKLARRQTTEVESAFSQLTEVLPLLNSMYTSSIERPVIQVFSGIQGLKEIYQDMLREKQPIYAALNTDDVEKDLYLWLTQTFTKQRINAGIEVKALVTSNDIGQQYAEESKELLRQTKLIDENITKFAHELDIYGSKVAFINYRQDQPLVGVIITHPVIAQMMKALFDLAWKV